MIHDLALIIIGIIIGQITWVAVKAKAFLAKAETKL